MLSLFITKLLAAIIALFMPFTATAPAFSAAIAPDADSYKPSEAIATWDVSDSKNDNVKMYYYQDNEFSLFDELTGAIRSVFAPINAYAAEEEENVEKKIAKPRYDGGTVIIDGEGATEEWLLLNWLDYDAFVPAYEEWCRNQPFAKNWEYILRTNIDEDGNYVGNMVSAAYVHAHYDNIEAILEKYIPAYLFEFASEYEYFWRDCVLFTPQNVIISGKVTEIGFAAFAFCGPIETLQITANVQKIDAGAFIGTSINTVTLPASVAEIGANAFWNCAGLANIYINGEIQSVGEYAFDEIAEGSSIHCTSFNTFCKLLGVEPEQIMPTANDGEAQEQQMPDELEYEYNSRTTVYYTNPAAQNN